MINKRKQRLERKSKKPANKTIFFMGNGGIKKSRIISKKWSKKNQKESLAQIQIGEHEKEFQVFTNYINDEENRSKEKLSKEVLKNFGIAFNRKNIKTKNTNDKR